MIQEQLQQVLRRSKSESGKIYFKDCTFKGTVYFGSGTAPAQPVSYSDEQVDVVEKLKPIFYNNEEDVRLFLNEIEGMQPNDITVLVNKWVVEKRISDYGNSRKGVLWEILNSANLYKRSRQNWCQRVD